jgi:hypothetical protein
VSHHFFHGFREFRHLFHVIGCQFSYQRSKAVSNLTTSDTSWHVLRVWLLDSVWIGWLDLLTTYTHNS